jgi:hypothetical protein
MPCISSHDVVRSAPNVHNQCNHFVYNSIEDGCCAQRNLSFIANILLLWGKATRPMSRATHAEMNHLLEFVRDYASGGIWGQPRWFHASPSFKVKVDVGSSGEVMLTGDVHLCGFTEQENEALSQWIEFLGVESVDKFFVTDQYIPEQDDFLITCTKRAPHLNIVLEDGVHFSLVDAPNFNDMTIGGLGENFINVDALSLHIQEYINDRVSPKLHWTFEHADTYCKVTERCVVWWENLLDVLRASWIKVYISMYMVMSYNEQDHVAALVHVGTLITGCNVSIQYDDDSGVSVRFELSSARFVQVYFEEEFQFLTINAGPALPPMPGAVNVAHLNGDYSRQSYMDYHDNQNQVERSQRNQQAQEDLRIHNEQVRLNERAAVEALQQRGSGLDAETLTRARDDTFACHKSNRILEADDPTCNYYVSNDGASAVRYGYRDTFGIGDCIPKDDIVRLRNNCYSRSALSQWFISRRAFREEQEFGGEALQIPGLGGEVITEAELDALGIRHQ